MAYLEIYFMTLYVSIFPGFKLTILKETLKRKKEKIKVEKGKERKYLRSITVGSITQGSLCPQISRETRNIKHKGLSFQWEI